MPKSKNVNQARLWWPDGAAGATALTVERYGKPVKLRVLPTGDAWSAEAVDETTGRAGLLGIETTREEAQRVALGWAEGV